MLVEDGCWFTFPLTQLWVLKIKGKEESLKREGYQELSWARLVRFGVFLNLVLFFDNCRRWGVLYY